MGDYQSVKGTGAMPKALPQPKRPHPNNLAEGEGTIGEWLRRHGQSDRAIERFWSVILVSALGETLDHASLAAARKVFATDFWRHRRPAISCCRVCRWARSFTTAWAGGWRTRASRCIWARRFDASKGTGGVHSAVILADGTRREFDGLIVAVPWRNVRSLLADDLLAAMPALGRSRADRAGGDHGRSPLVRPPDHAAASCRPGRPAEPMGVCEPLWCRRLRMRCARRCATTALPSRDQCLASAARANARCTVGGGLPRVGVGLAGGPAQAQLAARPGDRAAGGRVLGFAGGGSLPPAATNAHRESGPGGRLDGHRLARHDGRSRSQRLSGGIAEVSKFQI